VNKIILFKLYTIYILFSGIRSQTVLLRYKKCALLITGLQYSERDVALQDDPICGRQSTVRKVGRVAEVCEPVTTEHQMTVKLIENKLHVNRETTHRED